ncbi:signal peptidase I [Candidatus Daviesbacteria bacterium]|nr:signal peptidase I [Candidatus Daviesbacteria bacterium]
MSKLVLPVFLSLLLGFLVFGPVDTQFKKTASQLTALTTIKIPISGTGSMYPTFPKGQGHTPQEQANELVAVVGMYAYPNTRFKIGRGDIVEFRNSKTDQIEAKEFGSKEVAGFVKRIIGLPFETVEIRGGQILINGQSINEPYTARARSTFGGEFLADCTKLTIPEGRYFVLGDNRKASNDSRHEVGLIDDKDIGYLLPLERQRRIWDKQFRDTAKDNGEESKIKLDKKQYLEFLNSLRQDQGLKPLKYQQGLETSASLRGKNILKFNDFSFEASKSGFTIDKAFAQSGYWNPVRGESIIQGYYSSDELVQGFSEFKKSAGVITDKDIEEIGIAEVEGEINGCPTQVIVQHFAGYVPPNYPQDQINSFKKGLTSLEEISPSWRKLKEEAGFYNSHKKDIDRLLEIIDSRISNLRPIVEKITSNKWLTEAENAYLKEDERLGEEQNNLAEKINEAIRTVN